jgi:hypothetical protein
LGQVERDEAVRTGDDELVVGDRNEALDDVELRRR